MLPLVKPAIHHLLERNKCLAGSTRVLVNRLRVWYGSLEVLRDLTLSIGTGEVVSVIGPSGCGKSTFLNAIAGILKNARIEGKVRVNAKKVSYIFQEDTLLPWRTVLSNVFLSYELLDHEPDIERVKNLIKIAGLKGFEDYYPSQLSGGMKRRVDLIRAVAINPDLLLLDEPFGALDAYTRIKMQNFLHGLMRELEGTTTILVTHDVEEALVLSRRIIVLSSRPARVMGEIRSGGYEDLIEARGMKNFMEKKKGLLKILYGGIR